MEFSMGKPHEQLEAWKVAMQLVKSVYQLTSVFPAEERYGLAQQMKRAAVSIPSNIAEGAGRMAKRNF
jgi:four helix bundle protein